MRSWWSKFREIGVARRMWHLDLSRPAIPGLLRPPIEHSQPAAWSHQLLAGWHFWSIYTGRRGGVLSQNWRLNAARVGHISYLGICGEVAVGWSKTLTALGWQMLDFKSNLCNCDSKIQQYSNQLIKRNFTYCGVSYLFPPWLLACVLIDRTIFMSWNWKVPRQLTCSLVRHLNKLRLWSFLRLAENGCGYWKSDIWPKLKIWKSQFGFCDQSDRDREKEFPQTF